MEDKILKSVLLFSIAVLTVLLILAMVFGQSFNYFKNNDNIEKVSVDSIFLHNIFSHLDDNYNINIEKNAKYVYKFDENINYVNNYLYAGKNELYNLDLNDYKNNSIYVQSRDYLKRPDNFLENGFQRLNPDNILKFLEYNNLSHEKISLAIKSLMSGIKNESDKFQSPHVFYLGSHRDIGISIFPENKTKIVSLIDTKTEDLLENKDIFIRALNKYEVKTVLFSKDFYEMFKEEFSELEKNVEIVVLPSYEEGMDYFMYLEEYVNAYKKAIVDIV